MKITSVTGLTLKRFNKVQSSKTEQSDIFSFCGYFLKSNDRSINSALLLCSIHQLYNIYSVKPYYDNTEKKELLLLSIPFSSVI